VLSGATVPLLASLGGTAQGAVPVAGTTIEGRATFYGSGPNPGMNCSFPAGIPADNLYTAAGPSEWAGSGGCGGVLEVTGPKGTARIMVTDQCPECEPGHLDLSQESFAAVNGGSLAPGIIEISYRAVRNPPLPGPLTIRIKEGSSRYWTAFLVINHGNPLASVEVSTEDGGWRPLEHTAYNYWLAQDGAGPGPYTLRVTDIYDQVAVLDDVRLAPEELQETAVWMYGTAGPETPRTR
jgi:expansin (peptidoglycan-binding protein)